jgi:hypothetical protein
MNAVPKDTALPIIMTKPTFAQLTYGKCITGSPKVLSTNSPEAASIMPANISPNTLNIEKYFQNPIIATKLRTVDFQHDTFLSAPQPIAGAPVLSRYAASHAKGQ